MSLFGRAVVTAFGDRLPPLWSTLVDLGATVWVVSVCMSSPLVVAHCHPLLVGPVPKLTIKNCCSGLRVAVKDQPIILLAPHPPPLFVRTCLALAGTMSSAVPSGGRRPKIMKFVVFVYHCPHTQHYQLCMSSRCRERTHLISPTHQHCCGAVFCGALWCAPTNRRSTGVD
uniref:Secreted protein n=1 Tax=Knipowitschia caucasica TaxID=637954 RepID=A0AAV2LQP5_KNICA